jgi:cysteine desulfurase
MIYLDSHATTPLAPEVIQAMHHAMQYSYANPGSTSHLAGREVGDEIERVRNELAGEFHCDRDDVIFTSGATESNNLALFGIALHPRQKRRKIVSVRSEHRAILDPLERLERLGFEIDWIEIEQEKSSQAGRIDIEHAEAIIDERTALVTIMHANNEIGVIQPIAEIGGLCEKVGAILHTDASQSAGYLELNAKQWKAHLISLSAHKMHGPKGVGALLVNSQLSSKPRLQPQIVGGGQQSGLRAGTLNSHGIIGLGAAVRWMRDNRAEINRSAFELRDRLWTQLKQSLGDRLALNGPSLESSIRLDRNLNFMVDGIEGQTIMLKAAEVAMSSGSACTSADPHPSHVLLAIGLSLEQARCSLRIGMNPFNTQGQIGLAAHLISSAVASL